MGMDLGMGGRRTGQDCRKCSSFCFFWGRDERRGCSFFFVISFFTLSFPFVWRVNEEEETGEPY